MEESETNLAFVSPSGGPGRALSFKYTLFLIRVALVKLVLRVVIFWDIIL